MNAIFSGPTPLAFVTGATGLLGNNLVREVLAQGFRVRALARSPDKAERQFAGLPVEIVTGDMLAVDAFAPALAGVDVVFHTRRPISAIPIPAAAGSNSWCRA